MAMRLPEMGLLGVGILWLVVQLLMLAWIEKPRFLTPWASKRTDAPGYPARRRFWRKPWLRAGAARAVSETVLVQIGLTIALLALGLSLPTSEYWQIISSLLILDGPCCVLWCALRLRLPTGRWWRQILHEGAISAALAAALLPMLLIAGAAIALLRKDFLSTLGNVPSFPLLVTEALAHFGELLQVLLVICLEALVLFLVFRVAIRLWLRWNRLRRTRLRWALTHAHLVVVVIGAGLLGVVAVGVDVGTSRGFPFDLLPVLIGLTLFTSFALAVVLPPSALFSYLFARRMTRRIEGLAQAASALRQGNYAMRVPVSGEDEIARLQSDFNAMAADLERTLRELQAERDAVATLLKARRELVASVSHELHTPVATLRGYLESTRVHWEQTPPATLRQDVQIMEQETIRLQTLIDDLFTLARAEVGRLELRCQPVDAGALARRVAGTMARLAWQTGRVEVVAEGPAEADEASYVFADPCRLEQVLQNLVHNGVRHTPPGGIVALLVQAEGDSISLEVRDTGEGIAPADLPAIWERFYRAENARTRADGGSGLGLALVKELTEAMGGIVTVESVLGEGSRFTLRLPRASASPVLPASTAARPLPGDAEPARARS
jgi:signal transduction histidine kinase